MPDMYPANSTMAIITPVYRVWVENPVLYACNTTFSAPSRPNPSRKTKFKAPTLAERGRAVFKTKCPKVKQFFAKPRVRNLHLQ